MSDFARYRVQCARRLYWCDWCHRYRIAQGDHYLYGFGITNGQKSATRLCTHCLTGSLRDSDVGQVWAAWAPPVTPLSPAEFLALSRPAQRHI